MRIMLMYFARCLNKLILLRKSDVVPISAREVESASSYAENFYDLGEHAILHYPSEIMINGIQHNKIMNAWVLAW